MIRATLGVILFAGLFLERAGAVQDESVERIRNKVSSWHPSDKDLALFQLDWAETVDEAVSRAKKEKRPLFCIVNYASFGDARNGHC